MYISGLFYVKEQVTDLSNILNIHIRNRKDGKVDRGEITNE